MKISRRLFLATLLYGVFFAIAGASTDTIIDVLSRSAQYSILLNYLRHHDLIELINTSRNSTLVAPINSAFASIKPSDVSRDLLLYHLVSSNVLYDNGDKGDAEVDSYLMNDSNEHIPILVRRDDNEELRFNDLVVVDRDIQAGTYRGVVQAIDKLMSIPSSACTVVDELAHTFGELLRMEYSCAEIDAVRSTLLMPESTAFEGLSAVENAYLLKHARAKEDRQHIINRHIIPGRIIPSEVGPTEARTKDDDTLNISTGCVVNMTFKPLETNILTKNGIVHTYGSLLSNHTGELITFTPEKYIYGLGADSFVDELQFRGLMHLINGETTDPQTIFVPSSAVQGMMRQFDKSLQTESLSTLMYHFMDEQYHLEDYINEEFLMTSKMSTRRLGNKAQRVKASATPSGGLYLNGIEVVSKEYRIDNTSIYIVEGDITPPPTLMLAVGPFFQNSFSVEFLKQLNLLWPPFGESWTVLLPTRDAWVEQGLVKNYLAQNETALREVFKSLIFKEPIYTDSVGLPEAEFLDGSVRSVTIDKNEIDVGTGKLPLSAIDVLFDSGVAHSIDTLSIPMSVEFSARDLIQASGRERFIELLDARNLSHVLEPGSGYTILVPSSQSLAKHNVTENSPDIDLLLSLHVLPSNPINSLFSGQEVSTLAEGVQLRARDVSDTDGLYFIQIVNGADHEIHIVNRGDTSPFHNNATAAKSTVLFIDRQLRTEWILDPFYRPPYHLKTPTAILIGVVGGAILVFCIISIGLYLSLLFKKPSEDTDPERDPLLSPNGSPRSHEYGAMPRSGKSSRNHSRTNSHRASFSSPPTGAIQGYVPRQGASPVAAAAAGGSQSPEDALSPTMPIRAQKIQASREYGKHLGLPGQDEDF